MENLKRGTILVCNKQNSILNGTVYEVIRSGKKVTTLEPVNKIGVNSHLIGLPSLRQPFNEITDNLIIAINEGYYSFNKADGTKMEVSEMKKQFSTLFNSIGMYL
jgi:hypothetical protein